MPTTHDRLGCPCGRRTANPEHRRRLHEVAAGSDAGQQFLVPIVPDADNLDLDLALLDEVDKVAGIPLREQRPLQSCSVVLTDDGAIGPGWAGPLGKRVPSR
jgi:hypothetical protein